MSYILYMHHIWYSVCHGTVHASQVWYSKPVICNAPYASYIWNSVSQIRESMHVIYDTFYVLIPLFLMPLAAVASPWITITSRRLLKRKFLFMVQNFLPDTKAYSTGLQVGQKLCSRRRGTARWKWQEPALLRDSQESLPTWGAWQLFRTQA